MLGESDLNGGVIYVNSPQTFTSFYAGAELGPAGYDRTWFLTDTNAGIYASMAFRYSYLEGWFSEDWFAASAWPVWANWYHGEGTYTGAFFSFFGRREYYDFSSFYYPASAFAFD